MCMPSPPRAQLLREPLVELAPRLGYEAPLLFERRELAVVELGDLAARAPELLALRLGPFRVHLAVVVQHDAVVALCGPAADEVPAHVLGHGFRISLQGIAHSS